MRLIVALVLFVGCGVAPEVEPAMVLAPPPAVEVDTTDATQILSPVPHWKGWTFDGPSTMKGAFVDAVDWWSKQKGHDLGESGGTAIHVIDMTDRPGPYGEWAKVHYRGDDGADIRIYEGALTATPEQLAVMLRHELGHVIGLQHSKDPKCLMWESGLNGGSLCRTEESLLATR